MGIADKIIMDTLGLTPEDMAGIKDGIAALKDSAPELMERLEMNELRVYALCSFCKITNPEAWAKAEAEAKEYNHRLKVKEAQAAREKALKTAQKAPHGSR